MNKILWVLTFAIVQLACSSAGGNNSDPNREKDFLLADSIHYDHQAIQTLRELTSSPIVRLEATVEEDVADKDSLQGLEFNYDFKPENSKLFKEVRAKLKQQGYLLFKSEENFGSMPDRYALLKSDDQFDIIRFRATSGPNYSISNDSVLVRLQEWHKKYSLEIMGADADWVEAHINNISNAEINAFALELYTFCPDIVEQGTGTVESLVEDLRETKTLYLWWD